jgi:putative phage-type endonuclease
MLTEAQKKLRAYGIGSSEIAMLLGLSPFGGWHTLWRRKTGVELEENEPAGLILTRGTAYEPVIARLWADEHGYQIEKPGTIQHPLYTWCVDSCDYLTSDACVEVKAPLASSYWKWRNGAPLENQPQCQWHMGHHERDKCWLVYDCGYGVGAHLVEFDESVWLGLVATAQEFWETYVVTGVEPPADGDRETARWLSRAETTGDMAPADDEAIEIMASLREAALAAQAAVERKDELENRIKQKILDADASGLFVAGSQWKVTYRMGASGSRRLGKAGLINYER